MGIGMQGQSVGGWHHMRSITDLSGPLPCLTEILPTKLSLLHDPFTVYFSRIVQTYNSI